MRASDIMTKHVVVVPERTPIKEVAELLVDRAINAVPVVDDAGEIVGIVSESDLVQLETLPDVRRHVIQSSNGQSNEAVPATAGQIMTRDVVALPEDADVAQVARMMLEHRIKQIPIVSGPTVVGIVSRRDVLKILARNDSDIHLEIEDLLDEEMRMIGRFRAEVEAGVVTLRGPADSDGRRLATLLARSVPGVIGVRFAEAS